MNEPDVNITRFSNKIRNHKYNIFTFFPIVLFNEFYFFGNQFYLLMTISQFFDALKVGFLFAYVAPLMIVLTTSMIKEAFDDIYRYKQDRKTNSEEYVKFEKGGNRRKITSAEIKIGDFIELNQNQRVPADMIVLKAFTDSENEGNNHDQSSAGNLFIRTDQLDGETDWKLRKAPPLTQKISNLESLLEFNGFIQCDPPSKMIYEFKGVLNVFTDNKNTLREALSLENTLWASTILASKKAIGIVIYTGKETRAQMNSSLPRGKVGMLDLEINTLNKILFVIMMLSSFIITALKGFNQNIFVTLITFFRFIVLLCAIIPISLSVNLDISKAFNSRRINKDKNIPDTIVRNSTIPEDLGRINYIFTDKTGTLTKNEMIFKRLSMEVDQFNEDNFNDIGMILQDECKAHDGPMLDLVHHIDKLDYNMSNSSSYGRKILNVDIDANAINSIQNSAKRIRRNRTKVIRDAIEAMALCNNVTPIIESDENGDQHITYQASSPDEVALVKFAEKMKMRLFHRTDKEIKIKNAADNFEEFDILAIFPFSSDTKRMGIILRNRKHNNIIFYLKGAENVMMKYVKHEYVDYIKENAENLACLGLRTLVLTQKIISEEYFNVWIKEYNQAVLSMKNRKEKVAQVIQKLENNMDFLCVTGVEDLLQDEVDSTIENLRNAGIKIWMLTGDKVETATCISISAGLKSKFQRLFFLRSDTIDKSNNYDQISHTESIKKELNNYSYLEKNSHILIIDGDSLEIAMSNFEKEFFEIAMHAPSVVCCRCSPTQKAKIVKAMKKYSNGKRCCSIGDGGNDVAMIQEADVGIGIVGKEGLQASLAADFSITKFEHLRILILWFGRLSYKNTATVSKFVIHRGLIISLIQFIFSIIFYCSAVPIYNGMLILGYSSIYTNLPVITLLLDMDTDMQNVMKFPDLYRKLLQGRELSIKSFLWWFWKSLFQASVIMIGAILIFGDMLYLKIATITFTALIFAELLNVYTEIRKFHKYMLISLFFTLSIYCLSLKFLKEILDVYYIYDLITISKILLITVISWLPFYISYKFKSYCYPEAHEKLNLIQLETTIQT